jgi:hypothetical protein
VTRLLQFATQAAGSLNRRRVVSVELPEFIIRAIHQRVEEANGDGEPEGSVDFNDVVEWLLVTEVTLKRMPSLEVAIPGFTAAMASWLLKSTYNPDEEE